MEIYLNGEKLEVEGIESQTNLLELVETVEESLKGSGTTIVEIAVDDNVYSPDDTERIEAIKIVEKNKIELICANAIEMIEVAIKDSAAGLAHLEELAMEVSTDLRVGKVKDAMDKYLQFIDGLEWFTTMLKNADKAFASAMAESSIEAERQDLISQLDEQTQAIQDAQETEDWVGLADILEYEFPEIFQSGQNLFERLLQK